MKKIYLIRHCEATGQGPQAELTKNGVMKSEDILDFFRDKNIDCIISSPYKRAVKSIEGVAKVKNLVLNLDDRLIEKKLSSIPIDHWEEKLKLSFEDLDIKFNEGESSREAMSRAFELIHEMINSKYDHCILVTHGALSTLILKYFDYTYGYEQWKTMATPEIFLIERKSENDIKISKQYL